MIVPLLSRPDWELLVYGPEGLVVADAYLNSNVPENTMIPVSIVYIAIYTIPIFLSGFWSDFYCITIIMICMKSDRHPYCTCLLLYYYYHDLYEVRSPSVLYVFVIVLPLS